MDEEEIADELYGLRPEEFTAARDRHARAARTAGERGLAARIRALRRPTLAAWAGNLLAHAPEAERLTSLGAELRRAQRELDGEQLRELLGQQRRLVAALAGQAARLAADAGHPLGEDARREVEQTLLAVLADEAAARDWAAGRLTHALSPPSDFARLGGGRQPRRPAAPRQAAPVGDLDQARQRRQERRRQELEQARQLADEAEDELRARTEQLSASERERDDADLACDEAKRRVARLREEARQAERRERDARAARQAAADRVREAERAVRQARQRAREASAAAERLARQGG